MPEIADMFFTPPPRSLPLAGVTLLLVEDSRLCSEAIRMMAIRAGARLRRADSLEAAHRHLRIYCPDVVVVDLGLPDGSGLSLIEMLGPRADGRPVILATSGDADGAAEAAALAAGADGFLSKPVTDVAAFRDQVVGLLGRDRRPVAVSTDTETPPIDDQALADDLSRITEILEDALPKGNGAQLRYCAQFIGSVAQTAHDEELARRARGFFRQMLRGGGEKTGQEVLAALRKRLADRDAASLSGGHRGRRSAP